jgi:hypothetical protein
MSVMSDAHVFVAVEVTESRYAPLRGNAASDRLRHRTVSNARRDTQKSELLDLIFGTPGSGRLRRNFTETERTTQNPRVLATLVSSLAMRSQSCRAGCKRECSLRPHLQPPEHSSPSACTGHTARGAAGRTPPPWVWRNSSQLRFPHRHCGFIDISLN